jgi:hypothetical protein
MDVVDDRLVMVPYQGPPFAISGVVDEFDVSVESVDELLVVSERLLLRANRLVAAGETFSLPNYDLAYSPSVEGEGRAVALTMLRSFDRVTSMRFHVWED